MYRLIVIFKDEIPEEGTEHVRYSNVKHWGLTSKETFLRIVKTDKTILINKDLISEVIGEKM